MVAPLVIQPSALQDGGQREQRKLRIIVALTAEGEEMGKLPATLGTEPLVRSAIGFWSPGHGGIQSFSLGRIRRACKGPGGKC